MPTSRICSMDIARSLHSLHSPCTTVELGLKTLIIMVRFCVRVSRPLVLIVMPQKSVRVSCLFLIENFGLASFALIFYFGTLGVRVCTITTLSASRTFATFQSV